MKNRRQETGDGRRFLPSTFYLLSCFLLFLLPSTFYLLPVVYASRDTIKIGIHQDVTNANISGDRYSIHEIRSGKKTALSGPNDYNLSYKRGSVKIAAKIHALPLRIVPQSGLIRVNGREYRGEILILDGKKGFTIVNELGIDDYIRGVIPREMSPLWPIEALKAQAVAARSYALKNLGKHSVSGFDLCSTVHCQVYGGASAETPSTDEAVRATSGMVLVDKKNEIVNTFFHATCGGHTEEVKNVWQTAGKPLEHLRPRPCRYCGHHRHFRWNKKIGRDYVRNRLRAAGHKNIGVIRGLEIVGRSVSGRARSIRVVHSLGTEKIKASRFRLAICPFVLRSTKITKIARVGKSFEFSGFGWGHGVGLCQAGAKGKALEGANYDEILRFYYRNTRLKKIVE